MATIYQVFIVKSDMPLNWYYTVSYRLRVLRILLGPSGRVGQWIHTSIAILISFYIFVIAHSNRSRGRHETEERSVNTVKKYFFHMDCSVPTADDWVVSNKELTEKTRYTVTGLPPGCKILVRVKAINAAGASVPRTIQHSVLVKEVIGELWKLLLRFVLLYCLIFELLLHNNVLYK